MHAIVSRFLTNFAFMNRDPRPAPAWLDYLFRAIGSLPLTVLYRLTDLLALLAYGVVRYRRGVVDENLQTSFPDLQPRKRKRIARGFYRHLGAYFAETLRLGRISGREMRRRMRFEGLEQVNRAIDSGRNVVLYLGHYANWEWISSLPLHLHSGPRAHLAQIYHPLENKAADRAFLKIRSHFGAISIPMRQTMRRMAEWRSRGETNVTGFIADQAPMLGDTHLWIPFLNHDTPVFTGPERIARMLDAEVYYLDISRPRRGYYIARAIPLATHPGQLPTFELTRRYYAQLEATIRRQPELWLWSHRRWKRTREEFERYCEGRSAERLSHL